MTQAVHHRLQYWEDELAQAALDNKNERAKLCEQFIREYTQLLELASNSQTAPAA